MPLHDVFEFAACIDAAARAVVGDHLVGTYVHGSAALGGFVAGSSDVDLLVVVAQPGCEPQALADALIGGATHCPGRGIELSVVTAAAASAGAPPWSFVLHVTTDPADTKVALGDGHAGDSDLLMHYAVCRVAGLTVSGPPPAAVFAPIPRGLVLDYLVDELADGLARASAQYAVLNACRAWAFAATDSLLSKIDGARWVLERADTLVPVETIRAARDAHLASSRPMELTAAAEQFVREVRARVISCARSA